MARLFAHLVLAAAIVTGTTFLLVAPALGAERYASPAGAGSDCSPASPCDLETAVEGAADGDQVIVAPGNYGSPAVPLANEITATAAVDVHGPAGGPRARVFSFSDPVFTIGAGAALRNIEIQHAGSFEALAVAGLAERMFVTSPADACKLAGDGALLRNSVCWASGDGVAVSIAAGGGMQVPPWTGAVRNVTAFSRLGIGIRVTAGNFAKLLLRATNVIARGSSRDVRAEIIGSTGQESAAVELDHSNYASRQEVGGGTVTVPGSATNQTAAPLLADDPLGDFHQLARSPTIDAGVTEPANGVADFEGDARVQGAGTDIGADEFRPPPPVVARPPAVRPRSPTDTVKPVVRGLRFSPRSFAPIRGRGASIVRKRRKARRGTRVRYRLSEAATLSCGVERRRRGKWRSVRGRFRHSGRAGANRFRFSGRLNGRRLRRGRYRLVGTARDAAGNRGPSVRATFRIVRR